MSQEYLEGIETGSPYLGSSGLGQSSIHRPEKAGQGALRTQGVKKSYTNGVLIIVCLVYAKWRLEMLSLQAEDKPGSFLRNTAWDG